MKHGSLLLIGHHFFTVFVKRKAKTSNGWERGVLIIGMNLKGKRALVTGGAVRIGKAITEALQAAGCEVVVHYRNSATQAAALSDHIIQADLESPEACASLIHKAGEQFGPLDILINNASIFTKDALLSATPERVLREFQINLFAPMELTRAFAAQTDQGAIVNLLDRRVRCNDTSCTPIPSRKKGWKN